MSDPLTTTRDDADAKAWFYLDHRPDIEAWVMLRGEARQLLDKHLVGVATGLEELAEELGAEPDTGDLEVGSFPMAGLRRPSWQHHDVRDVSLVMQWERARLLTPGVNEWPYVAVRVPAATGEERRRRISEAMKPVRSQLSGQSTQSFPYWRYVQPSAGASVDPDALMQALLASDRQLWDAAAPVLDALHANSTGAATHP